MSGPKISVKLFLYVTCLSFLLITVFGLLFNYFEEEIIYWISPIVIIFTTYQIIATSRYTLIVTQNSIIEIRIITKTISFDNIDIVSMQFQKLVLKKDKVSIEIPTDLEKQREIMELILSKVNLDDPNIKITGHIDNLYKY